MDNYGKNFEQKFKKDFLKTVSNSVIDRIYDTVNGLYGVRNICDFIGYSYPNIFYIECKTHKGASIPFDNITQYSKLVEKINTTGVRSGVVLWLYEKDKVYYIPISTIKKMKEDGKKSVGIKSIQDGYNIKEIPSIKKRLFMDSDYSCLMNLSDGE